jgi:hypothetical protein
VNNFAGGVEIDAHAELLQPSDGGRQAGFAEVAVLRRTILNKKTK